MTKKFTLGAGHYFLLFLLSVAIWIGLLGLESYVTTPYFALVDNIATLFFIAPPILLFISFISFARNSRMGPKKDTISKTEWNIKNILGLVVTLGIIGFIALIVISVFTHNVCIGFC